MIEQQGAGVPVADRARRALGRALDMLGWGPRQTPSVVVFQTPELRLRGYGGAGPAVLLVPAPIKRAYIWDLAPAHSVVARLLGSGCRTYVLEWLDPADGTMGLTDFADRLLGVCIDAVEADSGQQRPFLVGHSLGGTFAAIFATLHPPRLRGLVLAGAPLSFDAASHVLTPLVLAVAPSGIPRARLPGSALTTTTLAAAPLSVGLSAGIDRVLSLGDAEAASLLWRVERWALDEMAMPGALVDDIERHLYRDNALVGGTLVVSGRRVRPQHLTVPVLTLVDPRCALAPPASVEPFLDAVGSTDVSLLHYHGDVGVLLQHAGLLVGNSAHRALWPYVARWIRQRE